MGNIYVAACLGNARQEILFLGGTMILSNLEMMPNTRIVKHLGLVQGSTVRAKHIGKDILAGFKNVFGGEIYNQYGCAGL